MVLKDGGIKRIVNQFTDRFPLFLSASSAPSAVQNLPAAPTRPILPGSPAMARRRTAPWLRYSFKDAQELTAEVAENAKHSVGEA